MREDQGESVDIMVAHEWFHRTPTRIWTISRLIEWYLLCAVRKHAFWYSGIEMNDRDFLHLLCPCRSHATHTVLSEIAERFNALTRSSTC